MKHAILALTAVAMCSPAFAEQLPPPGARDPRVRTVPYDPGNVVRLEAADLRSTLLQFSPDETVDLVALGDATTWAFNKVRNLVFIKPNLSPEAKDYAMRSRSNMQVVTLKDSGEQRIYEFELVAKPAPTAEDKPLQSLTFTYPSDIAAAKRKAAIAAKETHDEDVARQRLVVDYYYGTRNWQYVGRGSPAIEPASVSDNGQTTAFRFTGNSPQPAIYQGQCDKADRIAAVKTSQDIAVVQGIAPFWCLRLDERTYYEVASVRFDPVGQNPGTGTTSPDVVRRVKRMATR